MFVKGSTLLAAWWAYRRAIIRLADLRVWFAAFELTARRCGLKRGQRPHYTIEEIQRLTGGAGGEHIRRSLQRLHAAGLLSFSETAIAHGDEVTWSSPEDEAAIEDILALVSNHERKVPVPRRIIRLIAGGARRVVIATILGHLLRCLYYRRGECVASGRCKASWIADVFGVDLTNVKRARQHLIQLGWLLSKPVPQRSLNRYGSQMEICLAWSAGMHNHSTDSPPPLPFSTTKTPPPYKDNKLSTRSEHQKPAERGPSGVYEKEGREGKPRMTHVVQADLREPARLQALFEQATATGLVNGSECDRLRFFGAAQHATVVGTMNPCGLFAAIVRRKLWAFITQADEDVARKRVMAVEAGRREEGNSRFVMSSDLTVRVSAEERARIRSLIMRSLQTGGGGDVYAAS